MNKFEEVTQSIEILADFMSSENKGDNKGCVECDFYDECIGKETCKNSWINSLRKEI
ncbi:hypothetical protein [Clostridium sp.]|jgi:hypothetical protein|uniref:hypothetical protein n=1 Tax=Clostridium sp. TaxID=1506 RepID=UPI00258EEB55|nr:hypothetical protein [Clostridium sp.]MDF2505600.1 hypothetical protein [Clostridium sp.]